MAALEDSGHTICDAKLQLEVISPSGKKDVFYTRNVISAQPRGRAENDPGVAQGFIERSGGCGADNVTDIPDYVLQYWFPADLRYEDIANQTNNQQLTTDNMGAQAGTYRMTFARLDDTSERPIKTISDSFEVRLWVPLDVERIGATRINPFKSDYRMRVKVRANVDFAGTAKEVVPEGFEIRESGLSDPGVGAALTPGSGGTITWSLNLKAGEETELWYVYQAPELSPYFHLLGPMRFEDGLVKQTQEGIINIFDRLTRGREITIDRSKYEWTGSFEEARKWQIASDAAGDIILLWEGATLPSGWDCMSCSATGTLFQQYLRASSSYGTATSGGPESVSHSMTFSNASTSGAVFTNGLTGLTSVPQGTHTHTWGGTTGNATSVLPAAINLKIIKANNPSSLPAGIIGMFDVSSSSLPAGWTYYSTIQDRHIRGENSTGTIGAASHTHAIASITSGAEAGVDILASNVVNVAVAANGHTHTVSGNLPTSANSPPYVGVVFGKLTAAAPAPNGLIAIFDSGSLPIGWSIVSTSTSVYAGRFPVGSTTFGNTGGATTHDHNGSYTFNSGSSNPSIDADQGFGGILAPSNLTHSLNYTISATNTVPIFRDVMLGKLRAIQISGTVYSDDGVTPATSTVKASVFSTTSSTPLSFDTGANGTFSIAVPDPGAGNVLTLWMASTTGRAGATVVRLNAASTTGVDIYQDRLIVRSQDGSAVTNSNIGNCDSNSGTFCATSALHYDVSGSNLIIDNDWGLYIWPGTTFTPGGPVTVSATSTATSAGGDVKFGSATSTFNVAANAISVGGDWHNSAGGTFTTSSITQTTTFTATGNGFGIHTNGTQGFANITLNGSGGNWAASSSITINNDLTVTAGTLSGGNNVTVVGGDVTGNGTVAMTGGTFTLNGEGNFGGTSNWSFGSLTLGNGSTVATTTKSGAGNMTVASSTLTLNASHRLVVGGETWTLSGTSSLPFVRNGILTAGTSTFSYTGAAASGNVTLATTTYYNFTINRLGQTFDLGGNTTSTATTTITAGTLDATTANYSLGVGGNWTNNGTFTSGSGTVTFNSTTSSRTISGNTTSSSKFYNLTFNATGSWSVVPNQLEAANDFTIATGTVTAASATTTIGGSFINQNGIFAHNNGTLNFTRTTTGGVIRSGSSTLNHVTINGSGGTWSATGTQLLALGNLTVTAGTLNTASGTSDIIVSGNIGCGATCGTITTTATNHTFTHRATTTRTFGTNTGTNQWSFYNLTLAASTTAGTITFPSGGTGTTSVSNNLTFNNGGSTLTVDDQTNNRILDVGGDVTINTGTTLQAPSSASFTVAGSWTNNGTFTHNSGMVTFDATATGKTIQASSSPFFHATFNGSGGSWAPATSTLTILGNLTIATGTFETTPTAKADVTVSGNFECGSSTCGTIDFDDATHTFTHRATSSRTFGTNIASDPEWTFYNLTFTASSGSPTITFNGTGTGTTTVTNALTLSNSGTALTVDDGTNNRKLSVGGDVTIGSGTTLQAPGSASFTVGGSWSNAGTLTHNSGTITFDSGDAATINSNGSAFFHVTFNGSGGSWAPATNSMTIVGNLTVTAGTFESTASNLQNVTVSGNVECGTTCGTITFDDASHTFTHRATSSRTFGTNVASDPEWTFYNLTFTASSGSPTITFNGTGTGSTTVKNAVYGGRDSFAAVSVQTLMATLRGNRWPSSSITALNGPR